MEQVRTRMAPSPTGNLHIGTVYATMWPYLFAKHNKGVFILRIEDTDRERSTKEFEDNIINGLKIMGFDWDEGPYHQMDRLDSYKKYTEQLLKEGKAYLCFCTKEELDQERAEQLKGHIPQVYSGKCRNLSEEEVEIKKSQNLSYVIRHKVPEDRGIIIYEDLIHGKIEIDSKLIGDTVIMRSSGIPLYNYAVVLDDIDMNITHVIRGDDHISNTPKQVLLFEALGKTLPIFASFSMVLNQDRVGKLSKRTGSTSLKEYIDEGYLPEAIFNYIALFGIPAKDGNEIFSKEEIIEKFDLLKMHISSAAWNQDKLDWINGEYIRKMTDSELTKRLQEFLVDHPNKDKIAPLVPLIKERIKKLSDFVPLTDFIFEDPEYDIEIFQKLGIEQKNISIKDLLTKVTQTLESLPKPWKQEEFEAKFRELAKDQDLPAGSIFQLIRVAVSGQTVTPPLLESIQIIGEDKTLERIKNLIEKYPNV